VPRWSVNVSGTPKTPVVVDARIVVGTDRGALSAFEEAAQPAP